MLVQLLVVQAPMRVAAAAAARNGQRGRQHVRCHRRLLLLLLLRMRWRRRVRVWAADTGAGARLVWGF